MARGPSSDVGTQNMVPTLVSRAIMLQASRRLPSMDAAERKLPRLAKGLAKRLAQNPDKASGRHHMVADSWAPIKHPGRGALHQISSTNDLQYRFRGTPRHGQPTTPTGALNSRPGHTEQLGVKRELIQEYVDTLAGRRAILLHQIAEAQREVPPVMMASAALR